MKILNRFAMSLTLLCASAHAVEPFAIKGRTLGQSMDIACTDGEQVENRLEGHVERLKSYIPKLKPMGLVECHVDVGTFAGQQLDGPIVMLLMDDRVIHLSLETYGMDPDDAATFVATIKASFGKSVDRKDLKASALTFSWTRGTQSMVLTLYVPEDRLSYARLDLKDAPSFAEYRKRRDANGRLISAEAQRGRMDDVK